LEVYSKIISAVGQFLTSVGFHPGAYNRKKRSLLTTQ